MAISVLGGSRRARLFFLAILQGSLLLSLMYWYSPLATSSINDGGIPEWYKAAIGNKSGQESVDSTPNGGSGVPEHALPQRPTQTLPNTNGGGDSWSAGLSPGVAVIEDPASPTPDLCVNFETLQQQAPGPKSEGRRKFPYVRPPPECRKFKLPAMESLIERMKTVIKDPDLFRLFENSYPNTLDTMVKWRGYAHATDAETGETSVTDEELTYVITGDIDAMWLRDSASQIYSYVSLLEPSEDPESLASLWRGLINSHARYVIISPYCHSFQPPPESGIRPTTNGAYHNNHPVPAYDPQLVFDCKWELDSLASFLQISAAYYEKTGDLAFFGKYSWIKAVQAAVDAAAAMRLGTYDEEGHVQNSAWTFTGYTNRGSETLTNDGLGNPVKENGMVRSGFRPSDDACIFQLLTPSNMMFAAYLEQASVIMEGLSSDNLQAANLTGEMRQLAATIRHGVALDAVVSHRDFGDIFAYEVDGYGSTNLMDDANVPSLLALPFWNYTRPHYSDSTSSKASSSKTKAELEAEEAEKKHDFPRVYQNTRKFVLSMANPYYAKGPALSAVGGPHLGPGKGWPMAATVAALTAYDELAGISAGKERDAVVGEQLRMVLDSTAGKGVIHETVDAWSEFAWTRSWFGWANGLFGELILKIAEDERVRGVKQGEGLLGKLWQDEPEHENHDNSVGSGPLGFAGQGGNWVDDVSGSGSGSSEKS